ncbi:RICIN domain-containing protein [Streptomyces sp.]|uniref:RICIN domain-containing protein n=1 Tax=Streptomyces sp. TaxID=1931 RepID=UPI002F924E9B
MSILKRSIALGSTVAAAIALAVVPTSASAATSYWELVNYGSGKCLEVADWSTANGAVVRQWDCTRGANQQWAYSNGSWVNQNSGKCLEIGDWSTAWGAGARQWDCTGGANQRWNNPFLTPGKSALLRNEHSGLVVEIGGWSTANGVQATQWGFNDGDNQKWNIKPSW